MSIEPAMTAAAWSLTLPGLALDVGDDLTQLSPHELAARALYGQSFGFTRAHLAALRWFHADRWDASDWRAELADRCALEAAGYALPEACEDEEAGARLRTLRALAAAGAGRVAALLPPDDPGELPGWWPRDHWPAAVLRRFRAGDIAPAIPPARWGHVLPGDGLAGCDLAQLPPHELAARALYGQPFGFSRAQLAGLRRLTYEDGYADLYHMGAEGTAEEVRARTRAAIEEALERVAALLPPD